jgi:hypothetical protein
MDIDNIENNLNSIPTNDAKVLRAILNTVAKNQALLEALIDVQLMVLEQINPSFNTEEFSNKIGIATAKHLSNIQADISSTML